VQERILTPRRKWLPVEPDIRFSLISSSILSIGRRNVSSNIHPGTKSLGFTRVHSTYDEITPVNTKVPKAKVYPREIVQAFKKHGIGSLRVIMELRLNGTFRAVPLGAFALENASNSQMALGSTLTRKGGSLSVGGRGAILVRRTLHARLRTKSGSVGCAGGRHLAYAKMGNNTLGKVLDKFVDAVESCRAPCAEWGL
jgi:hypothetical protein